MILDKDHMEWKLEGPSGVRFYYASEDHLKQAVTEGHSGYTRLASYIVNPNGQFMKSRTISTHILNSILNYSREEVLELFNFSEDK